MIFIKSLKLTNFGRHKHLETKIGGYVAGLTGPSGLGKSTVLQALQMAYSGSIDHKDPAREFIRRESGDKPPKFAEVESTFESNGREGRIVRRITRTSITHKLWWDGAKNPVTKTAEINAIMYDILGVDKNAINSTVFIRQGEMASMFKDETDRRDFYTKLLMLGHLDKISRSVEIYRSQIASENRDLGPVKDQAEAAARSAAAYLDEVEGALGALPDRADMLAEARQAAALLDAWSGAEEAHDRAKASLAEMLPAGEDLSYVTGVELKIAEISDRLGVLDKQKYAYYAAEKTLSDTKEARRIAQETAGKFAAYQAAVEDLGKLESVGDDPAPRIKAREDLLAKLDRYDVLPGIIAQHAEKIDYDTVEHLKSMVSRKTEQLSATRESYAALNNFLNIRREFMKHLESSGDHPKCPVCHSDNAPDKEALQREIDADMSKLQTIQDEGTAAKRELTELEAKLRATTRVVEQVEERVKQLREELTVVSAVHELTTRDTLESELAGLRQEAQSFAARSFEYNRLSTLKEHLGRSVDGLTDPGESELMRLSAEVAKAEEERNRYQWTDKDREEMERLTAESASLSHRVSEVQRRWSTYEAASDKMVQTKHALESCDYVKRIGKSFTVDEVNAELDKLSSEQSFRDEAKGRVSAAKRRLAEANSNLMELETRIAEQEHNIQLAKDLEEVRDAFKPAGVSMDYINYKFGKIAKLAGDYLAESGADFMVSPSEDVPLSYDFIRTDRDGEVWLSQSRMSGGQKVRLAVATLRAIHAMILPNVGLLALDEPTTHLDEEAERSMADMLRQIGEERTLQIIVCDHSPILIDAMSDQIKIAGGDE